LSSTKDALTLKYQQIPKTQIEKLEKILPNNVDTVQLAMDIDSIAGKYGISIQSLLVTTKKADNATTIVQPGSANTYETVSVDVTLVSTYENFTKFIEDLESSQRITDVRGIKFISTDNGIYEYKITLDTYWLK
jgi:Tfp pilus assembly protein PilO